MVSREELKQEINKVPDIRYKVGSINKEKFSEVRNKIVSLLDQ